MSNILVAGSGKIGSLIALLLQKCGDFQVFVVDKQFNGIASQKLRQSCPEIRTHTMDLSNRSQFQNFMLQHKISATVSCLPYYLNVEIAKACANAHSHYFDLTEDVQTTKSIKKIAENCSQAFVPQCGIAPGFVNIIAEHLMSLFDECHEVKIRVGGLPQYTTNSLKYGITWSLDGLINQYGNPCPAIFEGQQKLLEPLEDLELLTLNGCLYEAFNTSGGVGHLVESKINKVGYLNYKTIRYPGHCEKIKFLMNDLHLNEDRKTLYNIFQKSLPLIEEDIVIVYACVNGTINQAITEKHYFHQILPQNLYGQQWSAMQVATATSVCAVVDLVLKSPFKGLILHEKFPFPAFIQNRFASFYA
ncbi:MAG: saccharopine dehydrogenase family protein [Gammaproteobacteria bacterium]|nr:saccharopine dehydrogenase family protein [Gammaproteobacteria bacterium]